MNDFENLEKYSSNYSDSKLWSKLTKVATAAGLKTVYAVLLLYYVAQSPTLSAKDKAIIYGALGYFILPLDLIPDAIPVAGFTDDFAALVWAIHAVWANVTPEVEQKARQTMHTWFGDFDESALNNLF